MGPDGWTARDGVAEFEPVGALVGGTWRSGPENDVDATGLLWTTFGRTPPQRLPLGPGRAVARAGG